MQDSESNSGPEIPQLRPSVRREGLELLDWMKRLDEAMDAVVARGDHVTVVGESQADVTESFFLARRTFGSVFILMDWSLRTTDTDRTEDAALLTRKLLELYSRVVFIAQGGTAGNERNIRAMRFVLSDTKQHVKMLEAALAMSGREDHRKTLAEWQASAEVLEVQIDAAGSTTAQPNTHDILLSVSRGHALTWREFSDVAHGGVMGRAYQRDELTFGVPATSERQDRVMQTALAIMGEIWIVWADVMTLTSEGLTEFAGKLQAYLAK